MSIGDLKQNIIGGGTTLNDDVLYSIENEIKNKNKYIYIITLLDTENKKYTKIGVSKNVNKRFNQLQQQIEYQINLYYKKYIPNTYVIEKHLKDFLKKHKIDEYTFGKYNKKNIKLPNHTEWFLINEDVRNNIKNFLNDIIVVDNGKQEDENIYFTNEKQEVKENKSYSSVVLRNKKKFFKLSLYQLKQIRILKDLVKNDRELNFLKGMIDNFQLNRPITEKQKDYLRYIYIKYL